MVESIGSNPHYLNIKNTEPTFGADLVGYLPSIKLFWWILGRNFKIVMILGAQNSQSYRQSGRSYS